jgi:hypothetical protein
MQHSTYFRISAARSRPRRRFEELQRRIAEWYSELRGPAGPKKAAAARERAYTMLKDDLLDGFFEKSGR